MLKGYFGGKIGVYGVEREWGERSPREFVFCTTDTVALCYLKDFQLCISELCQQNFERLRRERFEQGLTWVDVLPQLLDRIHDTPGEAGLSHYQILFGRKRPLAGVPYEPPVECK